MANDKTNAILKSIIAGAVTAGLQTAATNTNNDLKQADVAAVTATVTPAVTKEIGPVIANATNQEPWYQSRVIIGTTVAMVCTIAKFAGKEVDLIDQASIVDLVLLGGQLVGGVLALYGRLASGLKPLGS